MTKTPMTDASYGIYELQKTAYNLEIKLNAANDRIKRLEEEGDGMRIWITVIRGYLPECTNIWRKAKEDK